MRDPKFYSAIAEMRIDAEGERAIRRARDLLGEAVDSLSDCLGESESEGCGIDPPRGLMASAVDAYDAILPAMTILRALTLEARKTSEDGWITVRPREVQAWSVVE